MRERKPAKRVTFSSGANTSPAWNPKTGQSVAFVSDRGGVPQLYIMNADGTDTRKLDLPDMGYVIDPAWSPNGQLLAFSWRRPSGNYDLYIMDVASRSIREITRDSGRNGARVGRLMDGTLCSNRRVEEAARSG